jgi:hypothetical protein
MHDLPDPDIVQEKQILRRGIYPEHGRRTHQKDVLRSFVILSETKDLLLVFLQCVPAEKTSALDDDAHTAEVSMLRLLIFSRHLERFVDHIDDRLHLNPFRPAGVEIFDSILAPAQSRHILFRNINTQ